MVSVNTTENEIFKMLSQRQRASAKTDIYQTHRFLRFAGKNMPYEDVVAAFKSMQAKGYGTLIVGRGTNPDRFKWNYNLRELADTVLSGKKPVPQNQEVVKEKGKNIRIVINVDGSKVSAKELDALTSLAKSLESK